MQEVFTSGDKIMVSVNFRSNRRSPKRAKAKHSAAAAPAAATAKPVCVIDIMSSPYRVIEESPKEVVDVYSDDDGDGRKKPSANNVGSGSNAVGSSNGPSGVADRKGQAKKAKAAPQADSLQHKTPSPKETPEKQLSQQQQQPQLQQQQLQNPQQLQVQEHYDGGDLIIQTGHKGPCTPPPISETMIDLTRGPQTPSDPDDSYDPCNPTESPDISWENQVTNFYILFQNLPQLADSISQSSHQLQIAFLQVETIL
jgi:hypothetical protein